MINSLAELFPELAAEWDCEANGTLRPDDVSCGSQRKVNWVCAYGHKWVSTIHTRVNGSACPYCMGKKAAAGETDLTTTHLSLVTEWHPRLNGTLLPEMVSAGSNKVVWWQCHTCGRSWKAPVFVRVRGNGCPYCAGKKATEDKSLLALRPDIAAEWHPTKNGTLTPKDVTVFSHKTVWWRCSKGHEWKAVISSRSTRGCPVCSNHKIVPGINDLATTNPSLAAEWHPTRNGSVTPAMIPETTTRKFWWICPICGYSWQTRVTHRRNGAGCPVCSGRVVCPGEEFGTLHPELVAEWHPTQNADKNPMQFSSGSTFNAWWKCAKCGYEWQAQIGHRVFGIKKCPQCQEQKQQIERLI